MSGSQFQNQPGKTSPQADDRAMSWQRKVRMPSTEWLVVFVVLAVVVVMIMLGRRQHNRFVEGVRQAAVSKFQGKSIVVMLLTRDGRRSDIESDLIGTMIELGIRVPQIDSRRRKELIENGLGGLKEGELCLTVVYHYHPPRPYLFDLAAYETDCRLIDNAGTILAAGHTASDYERDIPWKVLEVACRYQPG